MTFYGHFLSVSLLFEVLVSLKLHFSDLSSDYFLSLALYLYPDLTIFALGRLFASSICILHGYNIV